MVRLVCHSKHSSFSNRASGSSVEAVRTLLRRPAVAAALHLGIGKYFRIEVAPCDEDIRDVPLISNENVRNGSTVEDMLNGLRPGARLLFYRRRTRGSCKYTNCNQLDCLVMLIPKLLEEFAISGFRGRQCWEPG